MAPNGRRLTVHRFALAALLAAVPAASADVRADPSPIALAELDAYATGMTEAGGFTGVLLVARGDKVLLERAYGKRTEDKDEPLTLDARFNLASAGKMFTAVAILQQVAAGKVTLDSTVGEVIRDYPNREFAKVTIRQLLTHSAGAGDTDELFGADHAAYRNRLRSHADMITFYGQRAPAFPPGSKQEYGNYGHVVLGRMVEILSGEPFETYLQRHVFAPAAMARTAFVDCLDSLRVDAVGFATVDGRRMPNCATQPRRGFGAGGELSTARDMLAFVTALRAGKLLPPALFADAIRTHREFMGLGFFATDYGKNVPLRNFRWGHGGNADGACTDVRHYPRTAETIIVLSNHDAPACFAVANFLHRRWQERRSGRLGVVRH